jgi:hypothetical protein
LPQGKNRQRYAVFDDLNANGHDFRKDALSGSREATERLVQVSSSLLFSARLAEDVSRNQEKCWRELVLTMFEEFNLAQTFLRRRFAFIWATQVFPLLGSYLIPRVHFFDHFRLLGPFLAKP